MITPDKSLIEKIKTKKIYALEGNIGAGKTTMMKIIGQYFTSVEFVEEPVSQWQNLGGMNLLDAFYTDPQRWGFSFEFYSMLSKIKALLNAANSPKPVIVIERSILSNKVFIDLSHELGKLEDMEFAMLMNTYKFYLQHVYPQISGIIYLDTPVDECIKRITKRNRGEECTIERSYLQSIKEKMEKDILSNSSTMKVIRIDGMYDCERDKVRVCQDMENYLCPNDGNKIVE